MSSTPKCECFGNRYLCCDLKGGCYNFPVTYGCSSSINLSLTQTCTCYPTQYVCCSEKSCSYRHITVTATTLAQH